jgi:hypothetical protein
MSAGGFLDGAGAVFFLLAAVGCVEGIGCGFFAFDLARFFGGTAFDGGFAGAARACGGGDAIHNSTKLAG